MRAIKPKILMILTFVLASPALKIYETQADAVYKWTDPKGITHYSEEPPPSTVPPEAATTITQPEVKTPVIDPADDYYSIANQAKRLEERRLAAEKMRIDQSRQRQAEYEARARAATAAKAQQYAEPAHNPIRYYPYPRQIPGYGHPYHHPDYKHYRRSNNRYSGSTHGSGKKRIQQGASNSPALKVQPSTSLKIQGSPALKIFQPRQMNPYYGYRPYSGYYYRR